MKETIGLACVGAEGISSGAVKCVVIRKKNQRQEEKTRYSLKENRFEKEYHNSVMNTTQIAASFLSTGLQTSKELLILNFPLQ